MIHLNSHITSVTVFSDRAQIIRTAQLELGVGEHSLVFDKLPQSIVGDSFQVSAKGHALLSNIRFRALSGSELSEQNKTIIEDERQKIQDNIRTYGDMLSRLAKEKSFVENIADKLTAPSNESQSLLDADKWMQMINFYHEKLKKLDSQILEVEKSTQTWKNKLIHFESEVERLGAYYAQTTNQVHLNVTMKSEGMIELSISYLVKDASWKPYYELRVSSDRKMMSIHYNALIQQNTSEDWEETPIILSTGEPGMSGEQPHLSPWAIELFKPIYKPESKNLRSPLKEKSANTTSAAFSSKPTAEDAGLWIEQHRIGNTTNPPRIASVVFQVSGLHSIPSDESEYSVNVMTEDFPADFQYSSVPKLSPFAYLKARVINQSEYPFLAGEAFIFLDNQFVTNSTLKTIAPREEFWTSLGVDPEIPIERKFLRKYEKKQGETPPSTTIDMIYEYQIHIRNHKKQPEDLVIWDQLPISQSDEIKVELLTPSYEEDTEAFQKNNLEYVKWFLNIQPGEEAIIPFKFSIKYPRNGNVVGLE